MVVATDFDGCPALFTLLVDSALEEERAILVFVAATPLGLEQRG